MAQEGRTGTARRVRLGVLTLLIALVAIAATGLLGVHSRTVSATGGGYTLSVEYAGIARAGLDVPLRVTVTRPGGFDDEIVLAVDRDYLLMFEQQGFYPEAAASTSRGDDVLFTFDPPPTGDTFVLDADVYVQPADQAGRPGTIAVLDGPDVAVSVDFSTFLLP